MENEEIMAAFEQHHSVTADTIRELQDSIDRVEAKVNRPGSGSFNAVAGDHERREAQAAFATFIRTGDAAEFQAGMSGVSDPDGGYTIPSVLADQIIDLLVNVSLMRRLARVERVSSPDFSLPINKRGASSGWVTETGDRTATASPALGLVSPKSTGLYANVPVTNWLLQDSKYDIGKFVIENMIDEFSAQEGSAFVVGDGAAGKPKGFLTEAQSAAADDSRPFGTLQTVNTGNATAITADSLIDTVYSLRSPYRQGGGVAWLMNSTVISTVRKLKNGSGDFLWADSLQEGQPARLLGYPVEEVEDMPGIGAGTTPIAFGNWRRGYVILDVHGMTVLRDPFSRKGFTSFYVEKRTGGCVLDSNAIKLVRVAE